MSRYHATLRKRSFAVSEMSTARVSSASRAAVDPSLTVASVVIEPRPSLCGARPFRERRKFISSTVRRKRPAAELVVALLRLSGPPVDALAWKPPPVDHEDQHERDRDDEEGPRPT